MIDLIYIVQYVCSGLSKAIAHEQLEWGTMGCHNEIASHNPVYT